MSIRTLLAPALLLVVTSLRASTAPDATLTRGLENFLANGVEAGVRSLYPDRPELAVKVKDEMLPATKNLGDVIDTEIVAVQPISKRVTRFVPPRITRQ
jgi:hypothetical protein